MAKRWIILTSVPFYFYAAAVVVVVQVEVVADCASAAESSSSGQRRTSSRGTERGSFMVRSATVLSMAFVSRSGQHGVDILKTNRVSEGEKERRRSTHGHGRQKRTSRTWTTHCPDLLLAGHQFEKKASSRLRLRRCTWLSNSQPA